jgi:probable phosphoglycerate mutase
MSLEHLYLRHGESEVNITKTISNRVTDHTPLTELGVNQAKQMLNLIKKDRKIISVYSSPLTRAEQTARIIAADFGISIELADALREPYCGAIEGRNDPQAWQLHAAQENAWRAGQYDFSIAGGESYLDLKNRFVPFINHLISRHKDQSGTIVIVSHGSVLRNMLPLILSNISIDFAHNHHLGNCSYISALVTEYGLVCVEWDANSISPAQNLR